MAGELERHAEGLPGIPICSARTGSPWIQCGPPSTSSSMVRCCVRLELGDTSLYRIRELERRPRNHHLAGVDPRHLEQIIDEPRELVGSGGR